MAKEDAYGWRKIPTFQLIELYTKEGALVRFWDTQGAAGIRLTAKDRRNWVAWHSRIRAVGIEKPIAGGNEPIGGPVTVCQTSSSAPPILTMQPCSKRELLAIANGVRFGFEKEVPSMHRPVRHYGAGQGQDELDIFAPSSCRLLLNYANTGKFEFGTRDGGDVSVPSAFGGLHAGDLTGLLLVFPPNHHNKPEIVPSIVYIAADSGSEANKEEPNTLRLRLSQIGFGVTKVEAMTTEVGSAALDIKTLNAMLFRLAQTGLWPPNRLTGR